MIPRFLNKVLYNKRLLVSISSVSHTFYFMSTTALDFIDFVNKSPSPFHATHEAAELLKKVLKDMGLVWMVLYSLKETTYRQVLKRSRNATTGTARSRTMENTTLRVTVHLLSASSLVASINLAMASQLSAPTPTPLVSRSSPSLTRKRVAISKLVFSFMVVASGKEEEIHSFTQILIAYFG